jgi:hypothetical protein
MKKIVYGVAVLGMLLCSVTAGSAQVNIGIGIGLPNVRIGINLPVFPELVPVPGYPVYYAPRVDANYFFYDGLYWIYADDYWYSSYWYDGPWSPVEPGIVPLFILRIPVRYYRQPPEYFRDWRRDAPPRWHEHWGREWEQERRGWDKWKRGSSPVRAPLPLYQRQYSGDRYPRQVEQQQMLHRQEYRYQPRDKTIRRQYQPQGEQRAPEPQREEQRMKGPGQQDMQRQAPYQQGRPAYQEQRQQPDAVQHERQQPRSSGQEQIFQERSQEPRGRGQERREEGRGRERND